MVSGRDPGIESGRWAASRGRDCEWWAAWAWLSSRGLRLLIAMAVNVLMPLLIPLGEQITNGEWRRDPGRSAKASAVYSHVAFAVLGLFVAALQPTAMLAAPSLAGAAEGGEVQGANSAARGKNANSMPTKRLQSLK